MTRFSRIALFFLIGVGAVSCETDFDVNAPYTETTIVYALLNQNDTAHYIKINKAFLGEGNALEMATVYDSANYTGQLDVYLQQWAWGSLVNTYPLVPDASIPKEDGVFSNPYQVLYKSTASLDPASEYKLIIYNNETGKEITARTPIINKFSISKPGTSPGEKINWVAANARYSVTWKSAEDGKLYQVRLGFHYSEKLRVAP
ncbi:MAG: hypothetical protein KDD36_11725, partial [Flavobacteriales bacterium]|nr:hypothetical protein [Flavobacteriales bacterium]